MNNAIILAGFVAALLLAPVVYGAGMALTGPVFKRWVGDDSPVVVWPFALVIIGFYRFVARLASLGARLVQLGKRRRSVLPGARVVKGKRCR